MKSQIIDLASKLQQNNQVVTVSEYNTLLDFIDSLDGFNNQPAVKDLYNYVDANAMYVELSQRLLSNLDYNQRNYNSKAASKYATMLGKLGQYTALHPNVDVMFTINRGKLRMLSSKHVANIINLNSFQNEMNTFVNN